MSKARPERELGRHYFKEWRNHRGLSLKRVVARMETEPGGPPLITDMSLSRIERGQQPYSEEIINALAHALDAEPWQLISVNPEKDGQVIDLLKFIRSLDNKEAARAMAVLKAALGK